MLLLVLAAAFCVASCDPVPKSSQQELLAVFLAAEGGDASGLDAGCRNAAELVRRGAALRVQVLTHGPGIEEVT